jgi:beta-lactamase class A
MLDWEDPVMLAIRTALISTLGFATLASAAAAQEAPASTLQAALHAKLDAEIKRVADQLPGVCGYAVKDLTSGEAFEHNADLVFPTASSIKVAVLAELMRQAEQAKVNLQEEHTIHRSETVAGDPILYMLGDGTVTMTWRDIATFMVVLSDNSATNMLIGRLGMDNVNAEIARLGLTQTHLRRRMIDLDAARRGNENVSTPRELSALLEKLWSGGPLDADHTKEYFRMLSLPKDSLFNKALADTVPIADKPGALEAVRCDTGIIQIPGHPFVMTVMTTYLATERQGEESIEKIARLVYDYFDRLARSSNVGRVISEK